MRLILLDITWEYVYFQGIKYLQEETKSNAAIEANLEDGDEEESRCGIFGFCLLSFPQNERKIETETT